MTAGSMELHAAVTKVWNDLGLEWSCKQHWPEADRARFPALGDSRVAPGCPFPYVVFAIGEGDVVMRSSGTAAELRLKRMVKLHTLTFDIFAQQLGTGELTAKAIAAGVQGSLMAAYGGHPSTLPQRLVMSTSKPLYCRYVSDVGLAVEEDVYQITLTYEIAVDSPIGT